MRYAGGVTPPSRELTQARALYAFLRLALRKGNGAAPYRGPATFTRDALTYTNESTPAIWLRSGASRGSAIAARTCTSFATRADSSG